MIIGIDFGNINSFPAYISDIDPITHKGGSEKALLPSDMAKIGIPSVFHYAKGVSTYGVEASLAIPRANRRTLLKRRIGTTEVIDGTLICYDGAITGLIKYIVDTANNELNQDGMSGTNEICLAYPASFSFNEREKLRELAQKAVVKIDAVTERNIIVRGMIQEPAAAGLEYLGTMMNYPGAKDYTIMVYDLGGGTFDVAIVTAHQDANGCITAYEVVDQDGSKRAGNELTNVLEGIVKAKLDAIGGRLPRNDSQNEKMHAEVERMKIQLSKADKAFYEDDDGNVVEVTQDEFANECHEIIDETISVSMNLYNRSKVKPEMIVMTGGQSQMPAIMEALKKNFTAIKKDKIVIYKPQFAIALGTARFGCLNDQTPMRNASKKVVSLRTGKMIGLDNVVDTSDTDNRSYVDELIARNTALPMTRVVKKTYSPVNPSLTHTIYLVEAIKDDPNKYNTSDFKQIAELTIDFNTSKPVKPDFVVSVNIDEMNMIHFSAEDPKGKFKGMKVSVNYETM